MLRCISYFLVKWNFFRFILGVPWTKEEHRTFLEGLEKLGKGDWRGISRKFVMTRTPTQVASHAQKYFLRHTMFNNKKRRSSLFDMAINDAVILLLVFSGHSNCGAQFCYFCIIFFHILTQLCICSGTNFRHWPCFVSDEDQ